MANFLLQKTGNFILPSTNHRGISAPCQIPMVVQRQQVCSEPTIAERVYNVGRLDLESSGLILFTNDGKFAAKAGHPSYGLIKEYEGKN
jgi:16S rRNA U516 pseudouridylate synthase RsuA-like enzyme